MSTQESIDPRWRCSMVPAYALVALFMFYIIAFLTTLSEVDEFIRETGGQHCFVYSNIRSYTAFHSIEISLVAVLTTITALLARRGHCRLSGGFCLLSFISMWLFTYFGAGDCAH